LFKRKSSTHKGVVGLTFFSDGLALVQLETSVEGDVTLRVAESVDCGRSDHGQVLAELVQRHQLQHSPCCAVLARGTYNLIQIDQPDVPEAELRDAVRWQVKDLLDFPADQAVIELFSAAGSAGSPMNFAVAAAEEHIRYVVDVMQQANLAIRAIDIPELALRNVLDRSFVSERGVALLSLWRDNGLVTIVRNGELCMARRNLSQLSC